MDEEVGGTVGDALGDNIMDVTEWDRFNQAVVNLDGPASEEEADQGFATPLLQGIL